LTSATLPRLELDMCHQVEALASLGLLRRCKLKCRGTLLWERGSQVGRLWGNVEPTSVYLAIYYATGLTNYTKYDI
jgi:hypothetical protein